MNTLNNLTGKDLAEIAQEREGSKTLTDKQIADLARECGDFKPSIYKDGVPQFHTGLPGVIRLARLLLQSAPHPDTERLNHIIEHDRCRIGLMYDTTASEGVVEKIEFIFENPTCDSGPDVVRAAIDRSIKARELRKGDTH
jgi:hypothetical protein